MITALDIAAAMTRLSDMIDQFGEDFDKLAVEGMGVEADAMRAFAGLAPLNAKAMMHTAIMNAILEGEDAHAEAVEQLDRSHTVTWVTGFLAGLTVARSDRDKYLDPPAI